MNDDRVTMYTDGACRGNPGPGGWGVLLQFRGREKTLWGGEPHTTNNRMELMAAIVGLETLRRPCAVDLSTDSQYLMKGITQWLPAWKRRGWMTASNTPVKNEDLWRRLEEVTKKHRIAWHWVKGHDGDPGNECADRLANRGIDETVRESRGQRG